tara:strand:- start:508 stop:657 length:150 start_codon:yes stop_codon:yes gene_type:complete
MGFLFTDDDMPTNVTIPTHVRNVTCAQQMVGDDMREELSRLSDIFLEYI